MFRVCKEATQLLMSSYEETALISGISDIIVVQWDQKTYKTTPFLVCLGSLALKARQEEIKVFVNDNIIENVKFVVNKYGYLDPFYPSVEVIQKLQLVHGKNKIAFKTSRVSLEAQIYLYNLHDRLIISDMDGTMTKTDLMGIVSNYRETHYIHDGYETFINELSKRGYKIVWLTMRSMAMYSFSKKYINKYVKCQGALIPEPEEFLPSLKKQIMKKTSNIKTNMLKKIKDLYPTDFKPFAGGLGNRQNDAIAYAALGIPMDRIYIVSQESEIMTMDHKVLKNYVQLKQEIQSHFPFTEEAKLNALYSYGKICLNQEQNNRVSKKESKLKDFFTSLEQENQHPGQ